jgi:CHC2 zinc finger
MTPAEKFVQRLSKVKGRNGSWTACCPAHEDKSPSLSIRETEDGRVLVHCFGGCEVNEVLGAVGMDISDLFPERQDRFDGKTSRPVKPAFYASDLLRIASFECLVVMIAAYDMRRGKKLSESDMDRLQVAQQRIEEVVQYASV